MFKKLIILTVLLFISTPAFAQVQDTTWVRTYDGPANGHDEVFGMALDALGNAYVTGFSFDNATNNFYFATVKYYPNGDTAWIRRYNGPANQGDGGYALAVDKSRNVYVAGISETCSPYCDAVTIKYNPDGDTAWVRRYGESPLSYNYPHSVTVDDLGDVYIAIESWHDTYPADYVTIKYYPDGDTAWVRRYEGGWWDRPYSIILDSFGNILVTGSGGTLKYDGNGNLLWVGIWTEADVGRSMVLDASGNAYVAGYRTYPYPRSDHDFLLVKYTPSGDTAWLRTYNRQGNGDDVAFTIAIDSLNNIYPSGYSALGSSNADIMTLKYSSDGSLLWVRKWGGAGDDLANSIAIDRFQNVYVAGYTQLPDSSYDAVLIKYYSNGDSVWSRTYSGAGIGNDWASFVGVDSSGNIYVAGTSEGQGTNLDFLTIKYYAFLRGDANGNRSVTISDVVYLVNYLFKGGPTPIPKDAGDVNCDTKVSVSDVIYIINYLFKGGTAPCI
jgi:uncharacterized delta-60 repeat protein